MKWAVLLWFLLFILLCYSVKLGKHLFVYMWIWFGIWCLLLIKAKFFSFLFLILFKNFMVLNGKPSPKKKNKLSILPLYCISYLVVLLFYWFQYLFYSLFVWDFMENVSFIFLVCDFVRDRAPNPLFIRCWAKPMWMGGIVLLSLKMEVWLVIFSPLD